MDEWSPKYDRPSMRNLLRQFICYSER
jgi:hypothetical protein